MDKCESDRRLFENRAAFRCALIGVCLWMVLGIALAMATSCWPLSLIGVLPAFGLVISVVLDFWGIP